MDSKKRESTRRNVQSKALTTPTPPSTPGTRTTPRRSAIREQNFYALRQGHCRKSPHATAATVTKSPKSRSRSMGNTDEGQESNRVEQQALPDSNAPSLSQLSMPTASMGRRTNLPQLKDTMPSSAASFNSDENLSISDQEMPRRSSSSTSPPRLGRSPNASINLLLCNEIVHSESSDEDVRRPGIKKLASPKKKRCVNDSAIFKHSMTTKLSLDAEQFIYGRKPVSLQDDSKSLDTNAPLCSEERHETRNWCPNLPLSARKSGLSLQPRRASSPPTEKFILPCFLPEMSFGDDQMTSVRTSSLPPPVTNVYDDRCLPRNDPFLSFLDPSVMHDAGGLTQSKRPDKPNSASLPTTGSVLASVYKLPRNKNSSEPKPNLLSTSHANAFDTSMDSTLPIQLDTSSAPTFKVKRTDSARLSSKEAQEDTTQATKEWQAPLVYGTISHDPLIDEEDEEDASAPQQSLSDLMERFLSSPIATRKSLGHSTSTSLVQQQPFRSWSSGYVPSPSHTFYSSRSSGRVPSPIQNLCRSQSSGLIPSPASQFSDLEDVGIEPPEEPVWTRSSSSQIIAN